MKRLIFTIIVALGIITDEFLIFEYTCDYPEYGPQFYGFPFVQETSTTWVNSMSGEIYLLGFIGNLIFWAIIIGLIIFFFRNTKSKLILLFAYLAISWSLFVSFAYFIAIDWRLEFTHDNFKLDYYQSEIDCDREIIFSKFSNKKATK